jgi:hypothetical protein
VLSILSTGFCKEKSLLTADFVDSSNRTEIVLERPYFLHSTVLGRTTDLDILFLFSASEGANKSKEKKPFWQVFFLVHLFFIFSVWQSQLISQHRNPGHQHHAKNLMPGFVQLRFGLKKES